jgi:hypothetical protein
MGRTTRRRRVEPTDEWEQLALLCRWRVETATGELRAVGRPRLFETSYSPPQPWLLSRGFSLCAFSAAVGPPGGALPLRGGALDFRFNYGQP